MWSRACRAFGGGERKLADAVGRTSAARVLPGDAAIWRPVGHAAALAGFGAAARYIAVTGLHRIENVQESAQAAFDIAPPNPLRERESREPGPVRHALARGAALRVDGDRGPTRSPR